MLDKLKEFKTELEESTAMFIDRFGATRQSAEAVEAMLNTIDSIDSYIKKHGECRLTEDEIANWCSNMVNADGSKGGHWTQEQTAAVANNIGVKFEHITKAEWWCCMNMMYSDYFKTAVKYNVNMPEFYAELAKEFLFDIDGGDPCKKLCEYYNNIVL